MMCSAKAACKSVCWLQAPTGPGHACPAPLVDTQLVGAQVKGPERDIHSGNDGGVFNEPLSDLTKLLASLVDSRNSIMVPGFYEGVRPNTLGAALQRLNGCNEFSLAGYREALGIPKLAPAANMRSPPCSLALHPSHALSIPAF